MLLKHNDYSIMSLNVDDESESKFHIRRAKPHYRSALRLANPCNLRDNNNLPSISGRQSGKDSVQLC